MKMNDIRWIKNPSPIYWIVISVILVYADYLTGPFIKFPVAFLIPVALASWYHGRLWGVSLAVVLPLLRFWYAGFLWEVPWTMSEGSINGLIRIVILLSFALLIDRVSRQTRELKKEVQMLEGLFPICSFCKKIRDEDGRWEQIETYISERSPADFSHGVCPDCLHHHYGDVLKKTPGQ